MSVLDAAQLPTEGAATPRAKCPPRPAGAALAPGYRVRAHLHRTGLFDIYQVYSEERACDCVAKALRPDYLDDRHEFRRLRREARLLLRLRHPHLVRACDYLAEPAPILITEMRSGATLEYEIGRRGHPSIGDGILLGTHLCSAIHYLHHHRILHLDLKPGNVICERGMATLIDLSLARRPGRSHRGAGTRVYMAPEQARGPLLTEKTDVWGIGMTLYEALTGLAPFDAEVSPGGRDALARAEPASASNDAGSWSSGSSTASNDAPHTYPQLLRRAPLLRSLRRVPPAVGEIIDACLEPDPLLRPTVSELAYALESHI